MSVIIFENRKQFADQVFIQQQKDNCSTFDAIMSVIEQFNVDIDTAAAFIKQSHNLKSELQTDAAKLLMLKPT